MSTMRFVAMLLAAAISSMQSGMAFAQPTSPDDIVVMGTRLRELTHSFVNDVVVSVGADNQMARWDQDVCVSVAGLTGAHGQFVVDRIAQRTLEVGLRVGAPGCRPNVLIFVSADSNRVAQRLFQEDRSLFGYFHEEGMSTRGSEALQQFLNEPRPVRWWHVTQRKVSDGRQLGSGNARTQPGVGGGPDGFRDAQMARSQGSRLASVIRQDFNRSIVIVDVERARGVTMSALADYIAFVLLTQPDPGADTRGYNTILNLFDQSAHPNGETAGLNELTAWDRAFLEGVYSATREAPTALQQKREIAARMVRVLDSTSPPS